MADRTDIQSILAAAAVARRQGQAGEETRLLEAALASAPGDPRLLNARGTRALLDGDFGRARAAFAAAVAADPKEPVLRVNLATACRALRDDGGEQEALEGALNLDRLDLTAQLRLAELHTRLGHKAQAAQGWSNVVQMAAGMQDAGPAVAEIARRGRAYLAAHNAELASALDAALADELARLGGAARRFRACVDHSLGRRAIFQNHCHGVHYPFLPADEFFDKAHFPWLCALEAKTDAIRREAIALVASGAEAIRPYVRQDAGVPANKWSPLDNSLDWSACFLWEYGERNEPVCALCPETAAALAALPQNRIPGKAPTAFFSILKPGAHIPPHTGVTNTRAIIHLPLVVPPGCTFRVGGETRAWQEGEAFAFDDTIEHEAWNRSAETRIVLIFDVWNPHLTEAEQKLLVRYFEVSGGDAGGGG
jgi:aspartyl/asparaginyl beta-hydroxylase (cupin superfamily)